MRSNKPRKALTPAHTRRTVAVTALVATIVVLAYCLVAMRGLGNAAPTEVAAITQATESAGLAQSALLQLASVDATLPEEGASEMASSAGEDGGIEADAADTSSVPDADASEEESAGEVSDDAAAYDTADEFDAGLPAADPDTNSGDTAGESAGTEPETAIAAADAPDSLENSAAEADSAMRTLDCSLRSVDGNSYTVRVTFDSAAQIPEDAELQVVEHNQIPVDFDDPRKADFYRDRPYAFERLEDAATMREFVERVRLAYADPTATGAEREDVRIAWAKFLDVRIVADGEEVQPAAQVRVQVETTGLTAQAADTLEASLLYPALHENKISSAAPDDRAYALACTNLTGTAEGEEDMDADQLVSRIEFASDEIGEIALAQVLEQKVAWNLHDTEISVWGARSVTVAPRQIPFELPLGEGRRMVGAFAFDVDSVRAYSTSLWVCSLPDERATSDFGGVVSYTLTGAGEQLLFGVGGTRPGQAANDLANDPNTDVVVALAADLAPVESDDVVVFLHDTGYRSCTLELGRVTLSGEMPKGTEGEANDVAKRYADAEKLAGRQTEGADLTTVAAYDLSLTAEDVAYAPDADHPVQVQVENASIDPSQEGVSYEVLRVNTEGNGQPVNATAEEGAVNFTAVDDGTYVVVERVTATKTLTASDGDDYEVSVTYDVGAVPRDARLVVRELTEDEAAPYERPTIDALGGGKLSYARAFDIALVGEDGTEYEPAGSVDVSLRLADEGASERAQVLHFAEGENEEPRLLEAQASTDNAGEVTLDFSTESFSAYVVAYTVDFHLGDYTFVLEGGESVLLSEVLNELGITEPTLADVRAVAFSDASLLRVDPQGDDWLLTSLGAFDTQEHLDLTLNNGQVFSILVSDAQTVSYKGFTYSVNGTAATLTRRTSGYGGVPELVGKVKDATVVSVPTGAFPKGSKAYVSEEYVNTLFPPSIDIPDLKTEPSDEEKALVSGDNVKAGKNNDTGKMQVWKASSINADGNLEITMSFFQKQGQPIDFILVCDETGSMSNAASATVGGVRLTAPRYIWARAAMLKATRALLDANDASKKNPAYQNRVAMLVWDNRSQLASDFFTDFDAANTWAATQYTGHAGTDHAQTLRTLLGMITKSRQQKPDALRVVVYLSDFADGGTAADYYTYNGVRDRVRNLFNANAVVYGLNMFGGNNVTGIQRQISRQGHNYVSGDDPSRLLPAFREIIQDAISNADANMKIVDELSPAVEAEADANKSSIDGGGTADPAQDGSSEKAAYKDGKLSWDLSNGSTSETVDGETITSTKALKTGRLYQKTVTIPLNGEGWGDSVYSGSAPTNGGMSLVGPDGKPVNAIDAADSPLLRAPVRFQVWRLKQNGTHEERLSGLTFTLYKKNGDDTTKLGEYTASDGAFSVPFAECPFEAGATYVLAEDSASVDAYNNEDENSDTLIVAPDKSWVLTVGQDMRISSAVQDSSHAAHTPAMEVRSGTFQIYNDEKIVAELIPVTVKKTWIGNGPRYEVPFTIYGVDGDYRVALKAYSTDDIETAQEVTSISGSDSDSEWTRTVYVYSMMEGHQFAKFEKLTRTDGHTYTGISFPEGKDTVLVNQEYNNHFQIEEGAPPAAYTYGYYTQSNDTPVETPASAADSYYVPRDGRWENYINGTQGKDWFYAQLHVNVNDFKLLENMTIQGGSTYVYDYRTYSDKTLVIEQNLYKHLKYIELEVASLADAASPSSVKLRLNANGTSTAHMGYVFRNVKLPFAWSDTSTYPHSGVNITNLRVTSLVFVDDKGNRFSIYGGGNDLLYDPAYGASNSIYRLSMQENQTNGSGHSTAQSTHTAVDETDHWNQMYLPSDRVLKTDTYTIRNLTLGMTNTEIPLTEVDVEKTWDNTPDEQKQTISIRTIYGAKKNGSGGYDAVFPLPAYTSDTRASDDSNKLTELTGDSGNDVWTRKAWLPTYGVSPDDIDGFTLSEDELSVQPIASIKGVPGEWAEPVISTGQEGSVEHVLVQEAQPERYELVTESVTGESYRISMWWNYGSSQAIKNHHVWIRYVVSVKPLEYGYTCIDLTDDNVDRLYGFGSHMYMYYFSVSQSIVPTRGFWISYDDGKTYVAPSDGDISTYTPRKDYVQNEFDRGEPGLYNARGRSKVYKRTPATPAIYEDQQINVPIKIKNTFIPYKVVELRNHFEDSTLDAASSEKVLFVRYRFVSDAEPHREYELDVEKNGSAKMYLPMGSYSVTQLGYTIDGITEEYEPAGGGATQIRNKLVPLKANCNPYVTTIDGATADATTLTGSFSTSDNPTYSAGVDTTVTFNNRRKNFPVRVQMAWTPELENGEDPLSGKNAAYTLQYYSVNESDFIPTTQKGTLDARTANNHSELPSYSVDGRPLSCHLDATTIDELLPDYTVAEETSEEGALPNTTLVYTFQCDLKQGDLYISKVWEVEDPGDVPDTIELELTHANGSAFWYQGAKTSSVPLTLVKSQNAVDSYSWELQNNPDTNDLRLYVSKSFRDDDYYVLRETKVGSDTPADSAFELSYTDISADRRHRFEVDGDAAEFALASEGTGVSVHNKLKTTEFTVSKKWVDESGSATPDTIVADKSVTFQLWGVRGKPVGGTAVSDYTPGENVAPPASLQLSEDATPEPFRSLPWTDPAYADDNTQPNRNTQSGDVEIPSPNGFFYVKDDGYYKDYNWYYMRARIPSQNLQQFKDGNVIQDNVIVKFSNRVIDESSYADVSADQIELKSDAGFAESAFKFGDILVHDGSYYLVTTNTTRPNAPWKGSHNTNDMQVLGSVPSGGSAGGGSAPIDLASISINYTKQVTSGGDIGASHVQDDLTTRYGTGKLEYRDFGTFTLTADDAEVQDSHTWTAVVGDLPVTYLYYAVETEVDGESLDDAEVASMYRPTYSYTQATREAPGSVVITNVFDPIARVIVNNGSMTSVSYHSFLVNPASGAACGAFDTAESAEGTSVTIETLKTNHARYTLDTPFTFTNTHPKESLTLRSLPDLANKSVIKRGYNETYNAANGSEANRKPDTALITCAHGSMTIENIAFDGNSHTGRALYLAQGTLTLGPAAELRNFRVDAQTVTADGEQVAEAAKGAAVFMDAGTTLNVAGTAQKKVVFMGNVVSNQLGKAADGGAIAGIRDTSITVNHARFAQNQATANSNANGTGGAIALGETDVSKGATKAAQLRIQNAEFEGNTATKNGGAVRATQYSTATIKDSTFTNNRAGKNGGAVVAHSTDEDGKRTSLTVEGGRFVGNSAENGGALSLDGAGGTLTLKGAAVLGGPLAAAANTASANGGAVYVNGCALTVQDSVTLQHNKADNEGGAIGQVGGTLAVGGSVQILSNSANHGAGIHVKDTTSATVGGNANLEGNVAAYYGGGIYSFGAPLTVKDNVTIKNCKADWNAATDTWRDTAGFSAGRGGGINAGWGAALTVGDSVQIGGCKASYGGGINVEAFDAEPANICSASVSNSVRITGCEALHTGGAVQVEGGDGYGARFTLMDAAIIGNNLSSKGGAVDAGGTGARIYLGGNAQITGNANGGQQKNLVLGHDSNEIIQVMESGLGALAHIGVYATGDQASETSVYGKHGDSADPFATRAGDANLSNLARFSNDINGLFGSKGADNTVIWAPPVLAYVHVNLKDLDADFVANQLKIKAKDANGWAPVGVTTVPGSYFIGKESSIYSGSALATTDDDWDTLLGYNKDHNPIAGEQGCLATLDISYLANNGTVDGTQNAHNTVSQYLGDVIRAYDGTSDSGKSGFFFYDGFSYGYKEEGNNTTIRHHIDLLFRRANVTYAFGNNGISDTRAKDGDAIETRTYLLNAKVDIPQNLPVNENFSVEGFYTDADFTTPWNGSVGRADMTVYVKVRQPSYLLISNKSSNDYYFGVAILNGSVFAENLTVLKKGSELQDPETPQLQGHFYLFKVASGKSETLYLSGVQGLDYEVKVAPVVKTAAGEYAGEEITDLSSENIKLNDNPELKIDGKNVPVSDPLTSAGAVDLLMPAGPAYVVYGKDGAPHLHHRDVTVADEYDKTNADNCYNVASKNGQIRRIVLVDEGFDVDFQKTDGNGKGLAGATFKLYKNYDAEVANMELIDRNNEASSSDQTETLGQVHFDKVPVGVSYMKETDAPNSVDEKAAKAQAWVVLVGSTALTAPAAGERTGLWAEDGVLARITADDIVAQTGTGNDALQYALFALDTDPKSETYGKALPAPDGPDIAKQGILNSSATKRTVVLRKVGESDQPLVGATFHLYRSDLTEVGDGSGYVSGEDGVYFAGELPAGTYYLKETAAPSGYEAAKNSVFKLVVTATGTAEPTGPLAAAEIPDALKLREVTPF